MLIHARSVNELDFDALMEIYIEGNVENAEYFYPEEPAEKGLELTVQDFRNFLCEKFFLREDAQYWVLTENDAYVSALRLEKYEDGLLLEALETRPDRRRQGYAKQLIREVLKRVPDGSKLYSHVSKRNIPSLTTHRSCGFIQHFDYSVQSDGSISDRAVTFLIQT